MTATQFLVDGVDLDDAEWRWRLLRGTAMPGAAVRRTTELTLFRRPGVVVKPGHFDTGVVAFSVLVPASRAREGKPVETLDRRLSDLQAMFSRAQVITRREPGGMTLSVDVVKVILSTPVEVSRGSWQVDATLTVAPFWWETFGGEAFEVGPGLLAVRRRVSNG